MINGAPVDRRAAAPAGAQVGRPRSMGDRADGPALLRGVGVGRQLPVPVGQAGRLAPGRHAQPDGRPLAGSALRSKAGYVRSSPTSPTSARPSSRRRACRSRRTSTGSSRSRCTARASPTRSTTQSAAERHTQQYFEILGNRAMYKDGWWLSWMMPRIPWKVDPETLKGFAPGVWDPESDPVELYYLPDDFTQANNLADQHPEKVRGAQGAVLAGGRASTDVLPLLGGLTTFFGMTPPLPDAVAVHLLRRRPERRLGDDPADLQPLLHDQRRARDPDRAAPKA